MATDPLTLDRWFFADAKPWMPETFWVAFLFSSKRPKVFPISVFCIYIQKHIYMFVFVLLR